MKLRIRGNSIRLRLTQREVEEMCTTGQVSESVNFGQSVMRYSLRTADVNETSAEFRDDELSVVVPKAQANTWANTEQVGIESARTLGDGHELRILIEKDFACLSERPREDDSDAFPNPLAACST